MWGSPSKGGLRPGLLHEFRGNRGDQGDSSLRNLVMNGQRNKAGARGECGAKGGKFSVKRRGLPRWNGRRASVRGPEDTGERARVWEEEGRSEVSTEVKAGIDHRF